jgi:hypothetical protein
LSTLTKVFTVLLVVFSIALSVMTISVVAQTTNWRDAATKYQEHARVADTSLRAMIASSSAELATARDEVRAHRDKIGELEGQVVARGNDLAGSRAELAKVQTELTNAQAMNRGLLNQLQVAEEARSEYRKQRDDLEKRGIDLERRNVDLNDRVNELTANISVLLEEKRQYEQQLNILTAENERLSKATRGGGPTLAMESPGGAALPGVSALTPVAASAIRGRVVEVDADLVTISVGAADGVKSGMSFVISRGSDYVGTLQVVLVEPNRAAGRLTRTSAAPAAGDLVADATSLSGARN